MLVLALRRACPSIVAIGLSERHNRLQRRHQLLELFGMCRVSSLVPEKIDRPATPQFLRNVLQDPAEYVIVDLCGKCVGLMRIHG